MDEGRLTEALASFAGTLVEDYEISDVLHDLVQQVTEVLGAAGAGVSVVADDGSLRFATALNELVRRVEQVQETHQRGPCVDAHGSGEQVLVVDVGAAAARWPEVAAEAARVGVVAVSGTPMRLGDSAVGALNVYMGEVHEWSEEEARAMRLLADVATGYVINASRLATARNTVDQLQRALDSRVIVEQAKGMVAAERNISPDQAYELLREHARHHRTSVQQVAQAVVQVGLRP